MLTVINDPHETVIDIPRFIRVISVAQAGSFSDIHLDIRSVSPEGLILFSQGNNVVVLGKSFELLRRGLQAIGEGTFLLVLENMFQECNIPGRNWLLVDPASVDSVPEFFVHRIARCRLCFGSSKLGKSFGRKIDRGLSSCDRLGSYFGDCSACDGRWRWFSDG